mgnify:CR=1 FL=1
MKWRKQKALGEYEDCDEQMESPSTSFETSQTIVSLYYFSLCPFPCCFVTSFTGRSLRVTHHGIVRETIPPLPLFVSLIQLRD